MIKITLYRSFIILLFISTIVLANNNVGKICFGKNLAKSLDEHTDKLYLKVDNSDKLFFNHPHEEAVLNNLDITKNHIVKVYFDDQLCESWILNFSKLKTQNIIIWRSAGSWHTQSVSTSVCR